MAGRKQRRDATPERQGTARRGKVATAALWIAALVPPALWIALYGASVRLPYSLLDDEAHLRNSAALWANLRAGGLTAAIAGDLSAQAGLYNPGFYLMTALLYAASGGVAYHGVKFAALGLCAAGAWLAAWGFARRRAGGGLAAVAGAVAACVVLLAEVPGKLDFNSLQANWLRLHTTDSWMAMFLALHLAALAWWWPGGAPDSDARPRTRRAAGAVAAGMLVAACLMKLTAVAHCAALVAAGGVALAVRERRTGLVLMVMGGGGLAVTAAVAGVVYAVAAPRSEAYASAYSLAPADLSRRFLEYYEMLSACLGPLLYVVPGVLLAAAAVRIQATGAREAVASMLPEITLLASAVALFMVYLPWPYAAARYLLPCLLTFGILAGIAVAMLARMLAEARRGPALAGDAVGVAAAALVPGGWMAGVCLALAGGAMQARARSVALGALAGVMAVGLGYFAFVGGSSAVAARHYYMEREHRQFAVVQEAVSLARAGRRLGYLGRSDEHYGSIEGYLQREAGMDGALVKVESPAELARVDEILLAEFLAQDAPWLQSLNLPSSAVFRPARRIVAAPLSLRRVQRGLYAGQFRHMERYGMASSWAIIRARK